MNKYTQMLGRLASLVGNPLGLLHRNLYNGAMLSLVYTTDGIEVRCNGERL